MDEFIVGIFFVAWVFMLVGGAGGKGGGRKSSTPKKMKRPWRSRPRWP